jgi:hypothetical protein
MAFTPRVKIAILAASVAAFFLVVLLVVLPTVLINRPETRAALQQRLGALLGGEAAFDHVHLTLFPRVCATVGHPRLDMPDKVSARAVELDVCLKFLPLLRGKVVADSIRVQSPDIHLPIPPINTAAGGPGLPDPRLLLARMADLVKQIPETAIEINRGHVELSEPGGQRLEFRQLDLRLHHSGAEMEWALQGESDVLEAFSSRGRLETDSLKGTITLRVADSRPQPLQAFFLPDAPFQVLDTRVDLDVAVALDGPGRVTAEIAGKAPTLAFGYNRRETHLSIDRFNAQLDLSEKRLAVSISEFSARTPRATLELTFVVDEEAHPKIDIDLKGRGDLAGARDFTVAMLHEIPEALLVCDILRSGDVPHIHVNLHGDTWNGLTDLNNLLIEGRLENGCVYIPWIDLDLNNVSGDALITGGILEGRDLKARYKGTYGEDGTLRVGLSSADPVLKLDIFARAELSALPPLLARVVPDPVFRKKVALVQEFSGTAQGTLQLNGTHTDVSVEVQASELDVKARYEPIPYPLAFREGRFRYADADGASLRGVDVSVGNSRFSQVDLEIGADPDKELSLELSMPEAVLDLAEAFVISRAIPAISSLRAVEGRASFRNAHLTGKALRPETWRFRSDGTIQDLHVDSEFLPAPLKVAAGPFEWQGTALRFKGWNALLGESTLNGLTCDFDWSGTPSLSLSAAAVSAPVAELYTLLTSGRPLGLPLASLEPLSGTVRVSAAESRLRFPDGRPPLIEASAALNTSTIASPRLDHPLEINSGRFHLQGSRLDVQDVHAALGKSEIRRFRLRADWSEGGDLDAAADSAVIHCEDLFPGLARWPGLEELRENITDLRGTVSVSNPSLKGPLRDPRRWRLQAIAEVSDIVIATTFLDEPLGVHAGRLSVTEVEARRGSVTELRLDSARVSIGTDEAVVSGGVTLSPADTILDLDVAAETLDWNKIEKISNRIAKRRPGESRPVRGRIGLRAENFIVDRFHNTPFYADADITPQGADVLIERAGFCGMTLIGRINFDGPIMDAYLVPVVDVMPLDSVVSCLTSEKSMITGNFNLDGALQVNARREDIAKAMNGRLTFVSEDGTILQSLFFARLLSLLNLTEIYRGQLPDMRSQGLDYKRTAAAIEIKDGKVLINDWSIDGRTLWMGSRGEIDIASQKIDFTIMVSPFKTVDRIINSIPGVRSILGGRLVAIPMRATGDIEDPNVVALSPSAVGTSILEMIQRTLMLPIEIIQPLIPGMELRESGTITR